MNRTSDPYALFSCRIFVASSFLRLFTFVKSPADFAKKTHDSSPLAKKTVPKPEQAPRYSLHVTQGYTHEIKDFIRQYCYAADIIILKDFILPFY